MSTRRIFNKDMISCNAELQSALSEVYILLKDDYKRKINRNAKHQAYSGCSFPTTPPSSCAVSVLKDCRDLLEKTYTSNPLPHGLIVKYNRYLKRINYIINAFEKDYGDGIFPKSYTWDYLTNLQRKYHSTFFKTFEKEASMFKVWPDPNGWHNLKMTVIGIWNGRIVS